MKGCNKSGRDESRPYNAETNPAVGAQFIAPNPPPDTPANPYTRPRRSIRLRDYDYSQAGAYFITICTHNRECLFGNIADETVRLNAVGNIVQAIWHALPVNFLGVELDEFVVMPNHVHGIIILNNVGARFIAPNNKQEAQNRAPTLGEIVRAFKARCTHSINQLRCVPGMPIWQRNYHEHVIRNESSLQEIRAYIVNNPSQWAFDRENPNIVGAQFIAPNGQDTVNQGAMNRAPTGLEGLEA